MATNKDYFDNGFYLAHQSALCSLYNLMLVHGLIEATRISFPGRVPLFFHCRNFMKFCMKPQSKYWMNLLKNEKMSSPNFISKCLRIIYDTL